MIGFSSGCFEVVEVGFFLCECEFFFGVVCERVSVRDEFGEMVGSVELVMVVVEDGFLKFKKWILLL